MFATLLLELVFEATPFPACCSDPDGSAVARTSRGFHPQAASVKVKADLGPNTPSAGLCCRPLVDLKLNRKVFFLPFKSSRNVTRFPAVVVYQFK